VLNFFLTLGILTGQGILVSIIQTLLSGLIQDKLQLDLTVSYLTLSSYLPLVLDGYSFMLQ
jgi:hypothetical protein